MKLVIGNKNYSSWSFRPWIAMKALGIPFEEILVPFGSPLGNPEFRQRVAQYTPVGLVPVRRTGRQTPQVPPKPTVTFPSSRITGTSRPPESWIIRASSFGSALTLRYRTEYRRFA